MKWKGQTDGPWSQYATFDDDKHNVKVSFRYIPHSKGIKGQNTFWDISRPDNS